MPHAQTEKKPSARLLLFSFFRTERRKRESEREWLEGQRCNTVSFPLDQELETPVRQSMKVKKRKKHKTGRIIATPGRGKRPGGAAAGVGSLFKWRSLWREGWCGWGGKGFNRQVWRLDRWSANSTGRKEERKKGGKKNADSVGSEVSWPFQSCPSPHPQSLRAAGSQPVLPDCLPPSHAAYLTPPCAHRLAATAQTRRHC